MRCTNLARVFVKPIVSLRTTVIENVWWRITRGWCELPPRECIIRVQPDRRSQVVPGGEPRRKDDTPNKVDGAFAGGRTLGRGCNLSAGCLDCPQRPPQHEGGNAQGSKGASSMSSFISRVYYPHTITLMGWAAWCTLTRLPHNLYRYDQMLP